MWRALFVFDGRGPSDRGTLPEKSRCAFFVPWGSSVECTAFFVIFRGGIRTVPVICSMGRVFRRCHWFRGTRSRVCHWFRGTRSQNVIGFAEAHAVWPWSAECPHDFGNLFRGTLSSKRGRPATVVPLSSLSMRVRTRGPVVLTVVRRKGLICGSALGGPGGPKNRRSSMRRFDCGEEGPICCPCSEN